LSYVSGYSPSGASQASGLTTSKTGVGNLGGQVVLPNQLLIPPPRAAGSPSQHQPADYNNCLFTGPTCLIRSSLCDKLLSFEPPGCIAIPGLLPTTPDDHAVGVLFGRLELHLPIGIR
jgi:hypothetical protein